MQDERRAQLERIYTRLIAPSGRQLRFAALSENIAVSPAEADKFVSSKAERQLFAPPQLSSGKAVSLGPAVEYQSDIVDFKQFRTTILAVMDPFSRKMALEVLPSKTSIATAQGFRKILNRMPTPKMLLTDSGQEFKNTFNAMLSAKKIVHKYSRGINTMTRIDKGIATIKTRLIQGLTSRGNTRIDKIVEEVEEAYNNSYNAGIQSTPEKSSENNEAGKVQQFRLMQENARAIEHNHDNAEKKMDKVKEEGTFRVQKRETFQRGFKPAYTEMKEVAKVERSQVTDTKGKTYNVNEVAAVPKDTQDITPPDTRGRGLRDQRLRDNLKPYAEELYDALGDQEMSLTTAARQMSDAFKRAKPSTLLMKDFLKLFPNLFVLVGQGPATKVRKARRRIRGKQAPLR
jgi:hypothetical protein